MSEPLSFSLLSVGRPAAGPAGPPSDDEPVTLDALLAGQRGAVIVFWSAVCSHCRRYDERLNALAEAELPLAVIGCRVGESMHDLETAQHERNLRFLLLHDAGEIASTWKVKQTPTAFLLDAEGRTIYRGAIDDFSYPGTDGHRAYLDDAMRAHLEGRPIELATTSAFGCPTNSVYYRWPDVVVIGSEPKTEPES